MEKAAILRELSEGAQAACFQIVIVRVWQTEPFLLFSSGTSGGLSKGTNSLFALSWNFPLSTCPLSPFLRITAQSMYSTTTTAAVYKAALHWPYSVRHGLRGISNLRGMSMTELIC